MTQVQKNPCYARDEFRNSYGREYERQEWQSGYLYNLTLNETLQNHPAETRAGLVMLNFNDLFLLHGPYYFALLGPTKKYYASFMSSGRYVDLLYEIFDALQAVFRPCGEQYAPFFLNYEPSKQMAIYFTARDDVHAEQLIRQVNQIALRYFRTAMPNVDTQYSALVALSDRIPSIRESYDACCTTRKLSELNFFLNDEIVLTRSVLNQLKRPLEYSQSLDLCFKATNLLEQGNTEFFSSLRTLMLTHLRYNLSLERFREVMAYLLNQAEMLCVIYDYNLPDGLFDINRYLTIDACHQALHAFYSKLFLHMQSIGFFSHCVLRAIYCIKCHISEYTLSVQQIAEYAQVSASYLCRVFRQETGVVPVEFIKNTRLQLACRLLKNSGKHVYEIADETGFTDTKYFVRLFRRAYGCTPQQYRYAE